MAYLVTGAAGFIGFHTALRLLQRGEQVVGLDNLSDYYSVQLKQDRLADLKEQGGFTFHHADLADAVAVQQALGSERISRVIHLAAQPGIRYSLENPGAYVQSNLVGFVNLLEHFRHSDRLETFVYASSSSVYGGNTKMPFSEADRVDNPVSLYAATKKSNELIANVYAHLFGLPLTGLRFFTVYGPWGRPDMAVSLFTEAILAGKPIPVFNHGRMKRDFTYVDDIVTGVLLVANAPRFSEGAANASKVYNIGNNRPESLLYLLAVLEEALGRRAEKMYLPLQPGDVPDTYADIEAIRRDYGFQPTTPIEVGIPAFVRWYRSYHGH